MLEAPGAKETCYRTWKACLQTEPNAERSFRHHTHVASDSLSSLRTQALKQESWIWDQACVAGHGERSQARQMPEKPELRQTAANASVPTILFSPHQPLKHAPPAKVDVEPSINPSRVDVEVSHSA